MNNWFESIGTNHRVVDPLVQLFVNLTNHRSERNRYIQIRFEIELNLPVHLHIVATHDVKP